MDSGIKDGDGTTSDPVPPEIRSSPAFQRAFLILRMGQLEELRSIKTTILYYLAHDRSLWIKGRKQEHIIGVFAKYVMPLIVFNFLSY